MLKSIMKYKYLIALASIFGLSGLCNFVVSPIKAPVSLASPSDYVIENEYMKVGINKYGAVIHSIVLKKWNNNYHNTPEVILNEASNYSNCLQFDFVGENMPDSKTSWSQLPSKNENEIILKSTNNKLQFIKIIRLHEEKIELENKILNYNGLTRYSHCINQAGDNTGNFIVHTDKKTNSTMKNLKHYPGLFNFYKKENIKNFHITNEKDSFGFKTSNNFCVMIRSNNSNGVISYKANPNGIMITDERLTSSDIKSEVIIIPNTYSMLKKYNLENIQNYGFFHIILKPIAIMSDTIMEYFSNKFLALIICILSFVTLFIPLFYLQYKRKKDSNMIELKIAKNLGLNAGPEKMAWQLFKFHGLNLILNASINMISFYHFNDSIIGNLFFTKYASFLWIKDMSMPDIASIFNLFGLINIDLPEPLAHFGVIKLLLLLVAYVNIKYEFDTAQVKNNEQSTLMYLFLFIIIMFLSSVAQMITYIIFITLRQILIGIFDYYYTKTNKNDYIQV